MGGTLRARRQATLVLLLLVAAPALLEAQQFVCSPIHRGDTASRLARRLTGNSAAAYSLAFQIRDPSRQLFVPKSHYVRLSTRWEACVETGRAPADVAVAALTPAAVAPVAPAITSTPLPSAPARPAVALVVPATSGGSKDDVVLAATIASMALFMWLMYAAVDFRMTRPMPAVMQRAGEQFVAAFARPLIDPCSGVPPIQARLRFVRRAQRLEISIAPGAGRRYPNLVDHQRNVEYDVDRVMRILGQGFVVSGRLRAAGKWVVVPIRQADTERTGAK
jgi:hypothetical protein